MAAFLGGSISAMEYAVGDLEPTGARGEVLKQERSKEPGKRKPHLCTISDIAGSWADIKGTVDEVEIPLGLPRRQGLPDCHCE